MLRGMGLAVVLCVLIFGACAVGLSGPQRSEDAYFRQSGHHVQKKNERLAFGLGILPGGGSFYTGRYGFGVLGIFTWPFSIIWDPYRSLQEARAINYRATKARVAELRRAEIDSLEARRSSGTIDASEYLRLRDAVERRYEP